MGQKLHLNLTLEQKIKYSLYVLWGLALFSLLALWDLIQNFSTEFESFLLLFIGLSLFGLIFFVRKHLLHQQKIKNEGLIVRNQEIQVKKRLGDFIIKGKYEFQGRQYPVFREIEHRENFEMYKVLKAKGEQAQVEIKIDPAKPHKYFLSVY